MFLIHQRQEKENCIGVEDTVSQCMQVKSKFKEEKSIILCISKISLEIALNSNKLVEISKI